MSHRQNLPPSSRSLLRALDLPPSLLWVALTVAILSLAAAAPRAVADDGPKTPQTALDKASAMLEGMGADELGAGLSVAARYLPTGPEDGSGDRLHAVLQLVIDPAPAGGGDLELTLVAEGEDGREVRRAHLETAGLRGASPWVFLLPADLPSENRGVAVVVEQGGPERWGGTIAEWSAEPFEVAQSAGVAEGPLLGPDPAAAGGARGGAGGGAGAGAAPATVVTLVPPRTPEVSGSTRFETIVSDTLVERVDFLLDGQVVDSDRHAPYAARLDLASPPRPQRVEAVAYDGEGRTLGRTELVVNAAGNRFRIAFDRWEHDLEAGRIDVGARVDVPIDQRLDRVEFFLDETLVATRREPPFTAVVEISSPGPTDYVRAVATLADGSSIDTVELIAARGASERLDVKLVELYAVVTGTDDQPVATLGKEDFEILEGGAQRPVEGFGYGHDVPLLLGIVVDSSGSMDGIMNETKQAAGRFLGQVLRPQDRAFVVDFDTLPRLAQGVTGDLNQLFASFRTMRAEGFTAFYDSVVFSLLQFGTERGRKALVVLTDGDDYRSRYSPSRAIQDARKAGVPVYVIGLGDSQQLQRVFKTSDLEAVTSKTGGKVFLITDPTQLGDAYDAIERELRSQYLLTFYTPAGRDPGEIEVRVKKPGYKVRTVVGAL